MKRLPLLVALGTVACAGGPAVVLDSVSPRPVAEARRCVASQLEEQGFSVSEPGASEDGLLVAEGVYQRPDTTRLFGSEAVEILTEWGRFEVEFRRRGGSTEMRYTAGTRTVTAGPWGDPSITMTEWADRLAEACR